MDHIWWDTHRPKKSPGLLILEHWIIIFRRILWKTLYVLILWVYKYLHCYISFWISQIFVLLFVVQPAEGGQFGHLGRWGQARVILKLWTVVTCHRDDVMVTSASSRMLPLASLSSRILLMVTTPAVARLLLITKTPASTPAAASTATRTPTTMPTTGKEELWREKRYLGADNLMKYVIDESSSKTLSLKDEERALCNRKTDKHKRPLSFYLSQNRPILHFQSAVSLWPLPRPRAASRTRWRSH